MKALWKLAWTEIKLFVREPITMIFSFAFPILVLVLLGGIFGGRTVIDGDFAGVRMMNYYVPGYIALVVASIGLISLPVHLANYREHGVLRRLRASSVPEPALLGAQAFVSLMIGLVGGVLIASLGFAAYGVSAPEQVGGLILAFVLGVFAFTAIGVLLASVLPNARSAQAVGLLLWFVMLFVSGTSAPLHVLPGWMKKVGEALPLYHVQKSLEGPWQGHGTETLELLVVWAVGALAALIAARVFRWE